MVNDKGNFLSRYAFYVMERTMAFIESFVGHVYMLGLV